MPSFNGRRFFVQPRGPAGDASCGRRNLDETFTARLAILTPPRGKWADDVGMHAARSLAFLLRTPVLDRRLLAGTDPSQEADLVTRAKRVCSRRQRDRLADGLERVLAEAEAQPASRALSAAAPIARQDVRDASTVILDLARRLRSTAPMDPQGVLLVRRLLSDPASPLASHSDDVSLRRALRQANAALTPR
jgi:hypothetical protein